MTKTKKIDGIVFDGESCIAVPARLHIQFTSDTRGKTLSIDNGVFMFTIPFEPVEKMMKSMGAMEAGKDG